MTATAEKVRGADQGGKMATGVSPAGVNARAAAAVALLLFGEPPPPCVPGVDLMKPFRPKFTDIA
jgi:hypothetical protein